MTMDDRLSGLVQRRAPVDIGKIELMLATLIRSEPAYRMAESALEPEHFGQMVGFGLLWRVVKDFYATYNRLPERDLLEAQVQDAINSDEDISDAEVGELDRFLDYAYNDEEIDPRVLLSDARARWALNTVQQFREDQIARQAKRLLRDDDTVLVDIPEALAALQHEAEQVASISAGGQEIAFPDGWDEQLHLDLVPTGIEEFDRFLNGGQASGEIYGLLGPYGSCKTTLMVQLAVLAADRFALEYQSRGSTGPYKVAYLVSYEAPVRELRQRALGCDARIIRESVEGMRNLRDLSTSDALKAYEREMFRDRINLGETVPGEQDRARASIRKMNRHLQFIDFSGATDGARRSAGGGWVSEISSRIIADLRERGDGAVCGLIGLDYVGAMIEQYMAAKELDESKTRHLIKRTPLRCKKELAVPFDCPVWLLHQLSGQANEMSPAAQLNHTMAAESKAFGENLDFAFCIAKPYPSGLFRLFATKHRRNRPEDPAIMRVNGEMYRVDSTHGAYVFDSTRNQIVPREAHTALVDDTAVPVDFDDDDDDSNDRAEAAATSDDFAFG